MTQTRNAALALALSAAALLAAAAPSRAAPLPRRAVITQNRAALSGIARARRQNNAVIDSVQRNIRANQRRGF